MIATTTTFEIGELYVFTDKQNTGRIWGLYEGHDAEGRILLEAATSDFETFRLHITLPPSYSEAEPASRCELRDFAYNMGARRI